MSTNYYEIQASSSRSDSEAINEVQAGLKALLRASSPKSFHDSSARYPPPRCHPGTRPIQREYLGQWATGNANRLLWLFGPAGVGKSAIAQSLAEELDDRLGATFFFSRPNHADDPLQLFPSIAYQLSQTITSFGEILDRKIRYDPTVIAKPLLQQFEEIIVHPVQQLDGLPAHKLVIIIDGLDECREPAAHIEIIEIIASSIREETTPFLWALTSRPERHLSDTFNSSTVSPICRLMEIPPSHDADVEGFLIDKLHTIGQRVPSLSPWLSREAISALVHLSNGYFLNASIAVNFIDQYSIDESGGQLRALFALEQDTSQPTVGSVLSLLDRLYTLILKQLPQSRLRLVRQLLLATTLPGIGTNAHSIANLLHLSESQFRESLGLLRSVVTIVPTSKGPEVHFHHASFLDFLEDRRRSQSVSLYPDSVTTLRTRLLRRLEDLQALRDPNRASIDPFLVTWRRGGRNYYDQYRAHEDCITAFFHLCQLAPLDESMLTSLARFDYSMLSLLWKRVGIRTTMGNFLDNIPSKSQELIIRHYTKSASPLDEMYKPPAVDKNFSFILGHGSRKAFCWGNEGCDYFWVVPYPKHRLLEYVKRHVVKRLGLNHVNESGDNQSELSSYVLCFRA